MNKLSAKPGDIVVTEFSTYQHWSLVSDKVCEFGEYMLISATKRTNTVQEEPWHIVTEGKQTYVVKVELNVSITEALSNARSWIGEWVYSTTGNNCEHFVKQVSGLEVTSTQVVAGTAGAVLGVAAVATISEKPTWIKFLGGALLVGGAAIYMAKAPKKSESESESEIV